MPDACCCSREARVVVTSRTRRYANVDDVTVRAERRRRVEPDVGELVVGRETRARVVGLCDLPDAAVGQWLETGLGRCFETGSAGERDMQ